VMALIPVLLPDHLRHVLGDDALNRWQGAVSELLHAPLYPQPLSPQGQPAEPATGRLNA
jgi:hypothetical protein